MFQTRRPKIGAMQIKNNYLLVLYCILLLQL